MYQRILTALSLTALFATAAPTVVSAAPREGSQEQQIADLKYKYWRAGVKDPNASPAEVTRREEDYNKAHKAEMDCAKNNSCTPQPATK